MNKTLSILLVICFDIIVFSPPAQSQLPSFLIGTWQMEGSNHFEHWDAIGPTGMKGLSYTVENEQMCVREYLDLRVGKKKQIIYTATVINQNQGKGIEFTLTTEGNRWVFVNEKHDFPKRISYEPVDSETILVHVSGGTQKSFAYKLLKAGTDENGFDAQLAKTLGADDYGMKNYYFVLLSTGPGSIGDKDASGAAFRGHMNNISRLADNGSLVLAGPFGKNDFGFRGLFVLNANSIEEAEALVGSDPAVREGYLSAKCVPWYSTAALSETVRISRKIARLKP
jgi:uncharacterized protein YciI